MGTKLFLASSVRYITLFGIFAISFSAFSQDDGREQDSTATGYSLGRLELKNPSSIIAKYIYDPQTDRYIYSEKLGDFDINYPLILTPQEFKDMVRKEQMRQYFKEKIAAVDGKTEEGQEAQKNLLPNFYVDSNLFESIFGGNTIELIPQGSVEMDLGVLYTKQDNPSFSPRNRSNFSFDFDQRISLSLLGKVGERLQVNAMYDTESTFDFQNQIKLEYTPTEDDIVQKIEVGNVSMPLNSALIQGSQSLFGVKTQLQFGKTTVTGVFSEQQSQTNSVTAEGSGTVEDFEIFALDYDENRHYFLSHYFRDHYDEALASYPFVNSNIQITRIEVWVTNRNQTVQGTRNIVAVQDIGESNPENIGLAAPPSGFVNRPSGSYPANANNDFNPFGINGNGQTVLNNAIRDAATVEQGFGGVPVSDGTDYVLLENSRQLTSNEYTLDATLGYISLNQRLNNDEVLGVAFQYTVNGQVYQVGEFANDGVDATGSPYADDDGDGVPNVVDVDADGDNINENGQDTDGDQITDAADADQTAGADVNNDGILDQFIPPGQGGEPKALVVKMLKSNITTVAEPVWDLMMKNIYGLGAGQLQQDGFRLNIVYTDPSPLNYITSAEGGPALPDDVDQTSLLRVFNLDRLTTYGDPQVGGDGFFDFVPGLTVNVRNGSIIFTSVEPFGEYLFNKLRSETGEVYDDGVDMTNDEQQTYNANQRKYVYKSLYTSTKTAARDNADKNKFQLKGKYKSTQEDGIPIGGFNVPQGSVTVTAGGRVLQEGLDYTVDYARGRVIILDQALIASNIPIEVSTENNTLFGQQTKRFTGINVEHRFNENFLIGGTLINLNERPLTQKANYSFEPINNTIFGLNANYSTEVPFLTRLVNKLPNIDTDVMSNVSMRGEFAYLLPGQPKATDFNGKATSYVDDFEAAQTSIDVSSPLQWYMSSAPIGFGGELSNGDLASGYRRAKLAWYSIDPIFYTSQRPGGINNDDISTYATRRVFRDEIFPQQDIVAGTTQALYTLDLAYYPTERGAYNYSPDAQDGVLSNPEDNFGGMMRQFTSTDFEQSNVEFIEFWLMDPFIYPENAGNTGGRLTLDLGSISEDVLKDGRKQYENGLPKDGGTQNSSATAWGKVPTNQALVYAFDTQGQERTNQDVGYDGLSDAQEAAMFTGFAGLPDPSADNYQYFVAAEGSVLDRYKNYNGQEGNSPVDVTQTNRGSTTFPDVEDINRDNTMNTVDSYYEYQLDITPQSLTINNEYIIDVRQEQNYELPNGSTIPVRWLQFKIPINQPTNTVGGISDFRSIRFMRMFMSGFSQNTVLRLGTLDLVRGDYRRYDLTLDPDLSDPATESTQFEVAAVSIQENEDREPIPYALPPGVYREELINNNNNIRQNEQSLSLSVCDLEAQDSRAVYKNFRLDMRQYKNLEMFVHAESQINQVALRDNELVAFVRMGTDLSENFYQIELPLTPTDFGTTSPDAIWPESNRLNIPFELLQKIKATFFGGSIVLDDPNVITYFDENGDLITNPEETPYETGSIRVGIKGNPSFGDVRVLMLGLKNGNETNGRDICGEAWFNELRLSDLQNEGGWAGIANIDANIADFATVSATGRQTTIGFGGIDEGPNMRSREDVKSYDVVTNVNVGQLLPKKWGIQLPFNYAVGEEIITPQYDPLYTDIELQTSLDNAATSADRDEIEGRSVSHTRRRSVNLIGVRKERTSDAKPMPYDIENLTLAYSYNQEDHKDFEIEQSRNQNVRVGGTYNYTFDAKPFEPFKENDSIFTSKYWQLLKDFNFNYLPASVSLTTNITRQFSQQKFRDITLPPGSIVPEFSQRNYLFDRQFSLNYPVTQSLRLNFDQSQNRIVRNYLQDDDSIDPEAGGIYDGFFDVGTPSRHYQTLQANYDLPISKIPFLDFVKATYSYTADFQWNRGSSQFQSLENIPDLGNSVENANTHAINGSLDMTSFYNSIGLVKKQPAGAATSRAARSRAVPTLGDDNETAAQQPESGKLSAGEKATNTAIGILTGIKQIQVNYQQNNGTYLPGYLPGVGFIGTLRPTTGFIFGSQAEVRDYAARKGWLTLYQEFNQQYREVENRQLDIQAQVEFIPDLTIDVNMNRIYQETYNENYRVDPQTLQYQTLTGSTYGNFNISTLMIGSAFGKNTAENSQVFNDFRSNRLVIAQRLAQDFYGTSDYPTDENGYPVGYGRTNQAVLIPAFLSAYTGGSADNVSLGAFRSFPLPNWNIKYTGFMKLDWFKKRFKRFSVNHGYRAGYTINQFNTNLNYNRQRNTSPEDAQVDQAGNFLNETLYSNINLVEQFSPLIRLDFEMRNSVKILAEIRKDRALSLSFDNNLMTEINGNEYIIGLGYRLKDITFATNIGGKRTILRSDLNFKADLSLRQNETIVRYLDIDNNQVTSGQDIYGLRFTADYALSKNLTAIFYYDHSFATYAISTAFPQTTIRSGLTLRYNFGN